MTIVVDTNILPQNADIHSVELQILVAVARETGHELVLPSLVLEEASSQRRREIEAAFDGLLGAAKDARRFAPVPLPADMPVPGELAAAYGDELRGVFSIAPLPAGAGDEALRREIHRLRPAREGRGARDAAIWLTAKDIHARAGGLTVFLSANVKDFGSQGDLHEDLRREVEQFPGEFAYCKDVTEVLATIATQETAFVDVAFLSAEAEICRAVGDALTADRALEELDLPPDFRVPLRPATLARPLEVWKAQAFSMERRRVAVAWTLWEVPISTSTRSTRGSAVAIGAATQILLREQEGTTSMQTDVLAIRHLRVME